MTVTIDSPCRLSLRPSSNDKPASYSLDILGGSLWFPAQNVPSGVQCGNFKSAEIEVYFRTMVSGSQSRSIGCFVPLRIITLK